MTYEYRVYVFLAGDTRMQLCVCDDPEGAAAIVLSLCRASRPGYARIEVEIAPRTGGN